MLSFAPVLERLQAHCSLFKDIGFAINQAEAIDDTKRMPALYLLPATLRAQPSPVGSSVHTQKVVEQFDLVYFLNVTGAIKGTAARAKKQEDETQQYTAEVWQAIVGWTWTPTVAPVSVVSGQLVLLDSTRMIFSERFETWSQYRAERATLYP